jgi:hypothetical protein
MTAALERSIGFIYQTALERDKGGATYPEEKQL